MGVQKNFERNGGKLNCFKESIAKNDKECSIK